MNPNVKIIFGLFGGLAIFIFGMNMMSESLQKAAGERMKKILSLLTKNPILGVLAGALTTAVLQSSSATTVMAIGFVSAGLMTLPQAISIIFGANIGTTITAQIIAFKISNYIYLFIFVGFLISFVVKNQKWKYVGQTLFAFGLLFLGIETMGGVMKPLAKSAFFTDMIGKVGNIPVLGVLTGTLMTLVVQSSSATIAVLQNFASQAGADGVSSVIGLAGAIPILLGDNIGTTITALLASIGQNKDAKRTAVAHSLFNISGCLLFIWFVPLYAKFIQYISPKGDEVAVISRQIANAHTCFNIAMTLIWIPLIFVMVKIVMKIIPDSKNEADAKSEDVLYLDKKYLNQPAAALHVTAKEIIRCSSIVEDLLKAIVEADKKNKDDGKSDFQVFEKVIYNSALIRKISQKINDFMSQLFSLGTLTEVQANQAAGLLYVMSDIERIGQFSGEISRNVLEQQSKSHKTHYSKDALKDLKSSAEFIYSMFSKIMKPLTDGTSIDEKELKTVRENVVDLELKMRKKHIDRVCKGKCSAKLTSNYNQILHNIDRMSNSCVNLAETLKSNPIEKNLLEEIYLPETKN